MKGVSVIICCYNSGEKLVPTLNHLAKQQPVAGIPYELIIVDNNCTDNTIDIAYNTWRSVQKPFPITITEEKLPGLNNARNKGLQTARYDYIILCDDDNWLFTDYLCKVYELFEAMPDVALIGGMGEAVSDAPVPDWFRELQGYGYAVGDQGRQTGYVDSIYGAGMAIRKEIFFAAIKDEQSFILTDRTGNNLSSGGDVEICILIQNAGCKIYLDKSLVFQHYLNAHRLQWAYYLKLRKSFGQSDAYLQLYSEARLPEGQSGKRNTVKQLLSLTKYIAANLKYFLFPGIFKNARCAGFIQRMSMMYTALAEIKKMQEISGRIKTVLNRNRSLLHTEKV